MLVQSHDTGRRVERQALTLIGDTWATEVAAFTSQPCRAGLCSQGLSASACLATPYDLLRGVLAYVLGSLSTRRLGAWAVLVGLVDISEAAWRKRLRASND